MSEENIPDDLNLGDDHEEGDSAAPTAGRTPSDQKTAEELEWGNLKGNSQDRFQQILSERNAERDARLAAEKRLQESSTKLPPPPPRTGGDESLTDEERIALDRLKKRFKLVTQEDVDSLKSEITRMESDREDARYVEDEYSRLRSTYDGSNGLPKFSVEEVEDHMKRTGIYNPEKAFRDIYEDEFFDYRVQERKTSTPSGNRQYSNKPSVGAGSGKEEPLSVEGLQERMNKPDGRAWYEKNRDKILPLLGKMTSES